MVGTQVLMVVHTWPDFDVETGEEVGRDGALRRATVAVIWRGAVTVWRPDALLGRPCNAVWCCVAGSVAAIVSRAGASASVGVTGAALVVTSCGAASLGAWVTAVAYGGAVSLALAPRQLRLGCVVGVASPVVGRRMGCRCCGRVA